MKLQNQVFLLILSVFVLSCENQNSKKEMRWSQDSSLEFSEFLEQNTGKETAAQILGDLDSTPPLQFEKNGIKRGSQTFDGFRLLPSELYLRKNSKGKVVEFQGETFHSPSQAKLQQAKKMKIQLKKAESQMNLKYSQIKLAAEKKPIEIVFEDLGGGLKPYYLISFVNQQEEMAFQWLLDRELRVRARKEIGHQLNRAWAQVFPGNPSSTELTKTSLDGLVEGQLKTSKLKISSRLNLVPEPTNNEFLVEPGEKSFDSLQAFYFAGKAIDWFQKNLKIELPQPLEVKLHIGGNKPTNAAFYYDFKVRLGEGDRVSFKEIPRDPTIVAHEVSHAFVEQLSGLGLEGAEGSMTEAYCDFFSGLITDQAEMASHSYLKAPFKRTMKNRLKAYDDFNGKKYHDSLPLSGTLWQISERFGAKKAGRFAAESLVRMGTQVEFEDLYKIFKDAALVVFNEKEITKLDGILIERGWKTEEQK